MNRKINEKSLANLKPIKPGEVRNPLGINRKRPWSDRYSQRSEDPIPEKIRRQFNQQMGQEVLPKRIDLGGRGSSAQTYGSADGWWDTSREGDSGPDRGQASTENGNSRDGAQSGDTRGHLPEEDQRDTQRVTYQIVLPSTEEHPRQHEFIYSQKKRKIIRAGRRGGKTTGVAILAVLEFLKGKAVDYAAPVIEQVGKFWHEVVTALAEPIEFGIYRKLESEKTIFEPGTEHYIHCRTA